ncbi:acrosin-like [Pyrgilauda ruficollis]|uniref:acrosin-like n=1 Tax=Pyrgilauda ruficollis TaxID=221976 RepID=UPI001B869458|nr:acrosin-like [Pyrgilauda ruficollis]
MNWFSFLVLLTMAGLAHSVQNTCGKIGILNVVIGATQLTQPGPGAQVRKIKKLFRHENYKKRDISNDIALLELNEPVQCSSYIQVACVADPTLRVSELQNCWIAGWGSTAEGDSSDVLQEAKVQLIDVQLCNSSGWYAGKVHIHNVCAGYPHGRIDTCQVGVCHKPLSPQQDWQPGQHRPNTAQGLLCPATQSPSQPQLPPDCFCGGMPADPKAMLRVKTLS